MYNGIYSIINRKNGKRYIGQSVHVGTRVKQHFKALSSRSHYNEKMQKEYNKDKAFFNYEILEINIHFADLNAREKYWVDYYKTLDPKFGYNSQEISESRLYVDKKNSKKYDKK